LLGDDDTAQLAAFIDAKHEARRSAKKKAQDKSRLKANLQKVGSKQIASRGKDKAGGHPQKGGGGGGGRREQPAPGASSKKKQTHVRAACSVGVLSTLVRIAGAG
jgi:hypothetical protein